MDNNQNKDQDGAAVRGEAVALPAARFENVNGFIDADHVQFDAGEIHGYGVSDGKPCGPKHYTRAHAEKFVSQGLWREVSVSARAADALSEPSDDAMPNGLPPISASTYGSKTVCELEQLRRTQRVVPDNLPRWIDNMKGSDPTIDSLIEYIVWQSRAADAPANPSELSKELREYAGNSGYSHNDYADIMRRAADALDSQPTDAPRGECEHCHSQRPLHLMDCPIAIKGMAERKVSEAPEPLRQLLIDFSNNTYHCGLHLGDDKKYAEYLKASEAAEQALIKLFASQPTVAAQQGSIADDAQFQILMDQHNYAQKNGDFDQRFIARKNLIARIDSRAASAPVAPIAPDGWKFVPIMATLAQVNAAHAADSKAHHVIDIYDAMLAAAPAPQQEGSEADNG